MNALKVESYQENFSLFDVIEQPILLVSPDTTVLYANAAANALFRSHCESCSLGELLSVEGVPFTLNRQVLNRKQPVRATFRSGRARRYLDVYIKSHSEQGGVFYVLSFVDVSTYVRREKILLEEATTDSLTGILNRRRFMEMFEKELKRAARLDEDLSVLMFDIDHFKRVNDKYGHAAGDAVLKKVTRIAGKELREIDLFGRFGGEEFAVVLPGADLQKANLVAERLRGVIKQTRVAYQQQLISVTISVGMVSVRGGGASEALLSQADEALYAAKHSGRDAVSSRGLYSPLKQENGHQSLSPL